MFDIVFLSIEVITTIAFFIFTCSKKKSVNIVLSKVFIGISGFTLILNIFFIASRENIIAKLKFPQAFVLVALLHIAVFVFVISIDLLFLSKADLIMGSIENITLFRNRGGEPPKLSKHGIKVIIRDAILSNHMYTGAVTGVEYDIRNSIEERIKYEHSDEKAIAEVISGTLLSDEYERYFYWDKHRFEAWKYCQHLMECYYWPEVFEYVHYKLNVLDSITYRQIEHSLIKKMYVNSASERYHVLRFDKETFMNEAVTDDEKKYLDELIYVIENKRNIKINHEFYVYSDTE